MTQITPSFAHIQKTTQIDGPRGAVYVHWLDPESRQRWEAPESSGMRYLNFAPRQGGVERIEISADGKKIGEMVQHIVVMQAPELVVSHIIGTFNGQTTLTMQVTMQFEETATGTRITGTSQVCDASGADVQAQHEAGWDALFAAFAADFAEHRSE